MRSTAPPPAPNGLGGPSRTRVKTLPVHIWSPFELRIPFFYPDYALTVCDVRHHPGGLLFRILLFCQPGWFPVVGWYLPYPGDNGHDLFESCFFYHRVFFIVGGDTAGGDRSTMGNIWYTQLTGPHAPQGG